MPTQFHWVLTSSDCQLVQRGLACELGVRISNGPPDHDRHARINVGGFDLEILEPVRVVHNTGDRHEVDAIFEQDVTHKGQVGGCRLRRHLLVVGGEPTIPVDSSTYPMYCHGAKATAL